MTSPDAKKLWRRALKSTSIVHVFIAEKLMKLMNLHSIMSILVQKVDKTLQLMLYAPARSAIRTKVVETGSTGWETDLDIAHIENER